MILQAISIFHFYPPHHHHKTNILLHVQASNISIAAAAATTSFSSNRAVLIGATSPSYGRACVLQKSPGERRNCSVVARSNNPTALAAASIELKSAVNVVRNFYDGINRRDLGSVEDLIALDCIYEDLVFPRPFVGRKAILEFFEKFMDSISIDLQFVIDDISEEDTSAVGVTWHLEWKGKPFPFSKGCSFYRLDVVNGQRQIVYGRDCVEPATKPGETALVAIRAVTWMLQNFPFLADQL